MDGLLLVPPPRRLSPLPGALRVPGGLAEKLEGWTLARPVPAGVQAAVGSEGDAGPDAGSRAEGYELLVDQRGVRLRAAGRAGLFRGMMTLRQLVRQAAATRTSGAAGQRASPGDAWSSADGTPRPAAKERLLPALRVEDEPSFPVRGVMLDVSRDRVPRMETLLALLDLWAELKFNQVQLYTEHTFAWPSHPEVWREASPFTPAEVETLERACAERAIELVPCLNTFGHMERWLRHPRYAPLAECRNGFTDPWGVFTACPSTLNPLDPRSVGLLESVFDEMLPAFTSRQVNVGGDEPWELGQCASREACLERGRGRVYLEFLSKVHGLLERRGRAMQLYADILLGYPHLVRELPRGVTALDWGYEADHPFERDCARLAEAGVNFLVCPGTSSWNSIGGRWANARANILAAAREGRRAGAGGLLLTDWGDHGHWQQLPVSAPGWLLGAAAAWAPAAAEGLDVEGCLSRHFFRDPTGKAARALLELGGLAGDGRARFHNAGVLAVLLQLPLQPYHQAALESYRGHGFAPELERIGAAARLADGAAIAGRARDGALLNRELGFTADLLAHAARLGRARFATDGLSTAEVPSAARRALAGELAGLIERYESLWRERSRPGGLRESAGRMRALLESYRSTE